jgi:hypothetical protein
MDGSKRLVKFTRQKCFASSTILGTFSNSHARKQAQQQFNFSCKFIKVIRVNGYREGWCAFRCLKTKLAAQFLAKRFVSLKHGTVTFYDQ